MSDDRVQVRNAGDRRQVRAAGRLERVREERWIDNLREVMATPQGRIVMWELLRRAGIYRSVFNTHGSVQSYNVGRQDFGHELMAELLRLGDEPYLLMESEARMLEARENRAIDAQHQRSATSTEGADDDS